MTGDSQFQSDERAVSVTIGTILMVGMTIVLAASVSYAILDLGDVSTAEQAVGRFNNILGGLESALLG